MSLVKGNTDRKVYFLGHRVNTCAYECTFFTGDILINKFGLAVRISINVLYLACRCCSCKALRRCGIVLCSSPQRAPCKQQAGSGMQCVGKRIICVVSAVAETFVVFRIIVACVNGCTFCVCGIEISAGRSQIVSCLIIIWRRIPIFRSKMLSRINK